MGKLPGQLAEETMGLLGQYRGLLCSFGLVDTIPAVV
jgi:hypothetical protein